MISFLYKFKLNFDKNTARGYVQVDVYPRPFDVLVLAQFGKVKLSKYI